MSFLGAFRDDFYNAIAALPAAQTVAGPTATGVIPATALAGAADCFLTLGGTSQTFTTDTAVNIIAQLQTAVATAQKANRGGFASSLSGTPPLGVPNLFNVSWVITIAGTGITTGATLAAGAGVTLAQTGGLSSTALASASGQSNYVVTVTSAATITMTRAA
ncbi:MAG: hypothetical protein ACREHV_14450 [Rhizomicrobium sp.]